MNKLVLISFVGIVFVIGIGVGIFFFQQKPSNPLSNCTQKYSYINPLLGCGLKLSLKKTGYATLKNQIRNYIDGKKNVGEVSQVSVYFRDLEDGPWLGIDEHADFSPASLLKLPVMISYFNLADDNISILRKNLTITSFPENEEKQFFKPQKTLSIGQTYSIEDLIERMIIFSDNRASNVLIEYLFQISNDSDPIATTLKETGTFDTDATSEQVISVKAYASLFRLLYTSAYLSENFSEKALQILSEAKFNSGIVAGVPKSIKVAHKFGERIDKGKNLNQLHDCGIVYFPNNPYLLCIMTRGSDFNTLSGVIKDISNMVYKEVDLRKIK